MWGGVSPGLYAVPAGGRPVLRSPADRRRAPMTSLFYVVRAGGSNFRRGNATPSKNPYFNMTFMRFAFKGGRGGGFNGMKSTQGSWRSASLHDDTGGPTMRMTSEQG